MKYLFVLLFCLIANAQDEVSSSNLKDNDSLSKFERTGLLEVQVQDLSKKVNKLSLQVLSSPLSGAYLTYENESMSKYERIGILEKSVSTLIKRANEIQAKLGGRQMPVTTEQGPKDDGTTNKFNRLSSLEGNIQSLSKLVEQLENDAANFSLKKKR